MGTLPLILLADPPAPNPFLLFTSATVVAAFIGGMVTVLVTWITSIGRRRTDDNRMRRKAVLDALASLRAVFTKLDHMTLPVDPETREPDLDRYQEVVIPQIAEMVTRLTDASIELYTVGSDDLLAHVVKLRLQLTHYMERHDYYQQGRLKPEFHDRLPFDALSTELELPRQQTLDAARATLLHGGGRSRPIRIGLRVQIAGWSLLGAALLWVAILYLTQQPTELNRILRQYSLASLWFVAIGGVLIVGGMLFNLIVGEVESHRQNKLPRP